MSKDIFFFIAKLFEIILVGGDSLDMVINKETLANLSASEKEVVLNILKEYSETGDSKILKKLF